MFGGLGEEQMEGAIEALLFVSDEPVDVITLADMLEAEAADVQQALSRIAERRAGEASGIQLQEVAGGWRLYTHPAFHGLLEKYVLSWDTRRLSQAALETLAIVAYGQPITRQGVASIRGVNSDSSINSLVEKGLVRESGQAEAPGNPMTYSTTRAFLEKFGLRSTEDLPSLEDFAPDDETARFLREGLSAHARFTLIGEEDSPDADWLVPDAEGGVLSADAVGEEGSEGPIDADDAVQQAMRAMLSNALAESAGLVEKIDFDELEFEE